MAACGPTCNETLGWGVRGTCDEVSGVCLCPAGYSGNDDWDQYNDCRVNEQAQFLIWVTCLVLSLVTFALCSIIALSTCYHDVLLSCFKRKHVERVTESVRGEAPTSRVSAIAHDLGEAGFNFSQGEVEVLNPAFRQQRMADGSNRNSEDSSLGVRKDRDHVPVSEPQSDDNSECSHFDSEDSNPPAQMEEAPQRVPRKSSGSDHDVETMENSTSESVERDTRQDVPTQRNRRGKRKRTRNETLARWRKQRRFCSVYAALIVFLLFPLLSFMYYIPFLRGEFRFEESWYQDIGLAGHWLVYYAWYMSVPGVLMFSHLMKMTPSCLIRYPKVVQTFILARVVVYPLVTFFVVFGYSRLFDDSPETRFKLDTVFIIWMGVLAADFGILSLSLAVFGRSLLVQLKDVCTRALELGLCTPSDLKSCQSALRTVNRMIVIVALLSSFLFAGFLVTALEPSLRGMTYITVNLGIILGDVAIILALLLAIGNLRGSGTDIRAFF
eukprot:CAMPEP_0184510260 /NCGR_PEP_ID=MMETSP0198_2-20121128/1717_1 /TAXON_ID=1112570 /ORGANISM="Thraustochytrium sp., Strain LLF1b" /LENGTH=496 /DNA_ID=CAMNT_0026900135 /DNA_START=206 /DNA_END=1696 /DNA_ORIENTATION=+